MQRRAARGNAPRKAGNAVHAFSKKNGVMGKLGGARSPAERTPLATQTHRFFPARCLRARVTRGIGIGIGIGRHHKAQQACGLSFGKVCGPVRHRRGGARPGAQEARSIPWRFRSCALAAFPAGRLRPHRPFSPSSKLATLDHLLSTNAPGHTSSWGGDFEVLCRRLRYRTLWSPVLLFTRHSARSSRRSRSSRTTASCPSCCTSGSSLGRLRIRQWSRRSLACSCR